MLAVANVTLSDDTLQELFRRTEGWPAAVYLAALSLVGGWPGRVRGVRAPAQRQRPVHR